jgi:hypothetical protein
VEERADEDEEEEWPMVTFTYPANYVKRTKLERAGAYPA